LRRALLEIVEKRGHGSSRCCPNLLPSGLGGLFAGPLLQGRPPARKPQAAARRQETPAARLTSENCAPAELVQFSCVCVTMAQLTCVVVWRISEVTEIETAPGPVWV